MFTSELWQQSGVSTYSIDQSIRFNPADTPYMHKTYSGAGDRTAWTFSTWFKLGECNGMASSGGLYYVFFACDNATNDANRGIFSINNDSSESSSMQIQFEGHSTKFLRTNRKLRDPSSWYHITLVWDSDNAVAQDRCRLYINGERETSFATQNNPTSGQEIGINLAAKHTIGAGINISTSGVVYHFDGYMAETVFLDGTATDASSFGEFKEDSDIWVPKDVSDLTFGTNGFWIDGRDSSAFGDDEAGSNDYTTSGLAAHDFCLDSPTNNFAVMNPLLTKDSDFEYSEGNLKIDFNSNTAWTNGMGASMSMSSGKWYWEVYWTTGTHYTMFGILPTELLHTCADSGSSGLYTLGNFFQARSGGSTYDFYKQVSTDTTPSGDFAQGDYLQFALDMDNKKFWWGKNNTWFSSGNPSAGSNEMIGSADLPSDGYTPVFLGYSSGGDSVVQVNFGQDSTFAGVVSAGGNSDGSGIGNFKYAPPSGFKALCTKNLGS